MKDKNTFENLNFNHTAMLPILYSSIVCSSARNRKSLRTRNVWKWKKSFEHFFRVFIDFFLVIFCDMRNFFLFIFAHVLVSCSIIIDKTRILCVHMTNGGKSVQHNSDARCITSCLHSKKSYARWREKSCQLSKISLWIAKRQWIESGYFLKRDAPVDDDAQNCKQLNLQVISRFIVKAAIEQCMHSMFNDHLVDAAEADFSFIKYSFNFFFPSIKFFFSADDGWICKIVWIEVWARSRGGKDGEPLRFLCFECFLHIYNKQLELKLIEFEYVLQRIASEEHKSQLR